MKKVVTSLLYILLVTVLLVGCGSNGSNSKQSNENQSGSSSSTEKKESGSKGKVTITLWSLSTGWEWLVEAAEEFEKQNPDIDVDVSTYATDPIKENLRVAASSKTLPDMWFTWGGSLGSFYPENGLALDLTEIGKEHNYEAIYNKAAIERSSYDGKLYGIPLKLNVLGGWYNKEIYAEAGLTAPKTFAEFESQLEVLKANGIIPLAFGSKNGWHTMRLAEAILEHYAGPALHDQLLNFETSWENEAVVKTFEKLKEYTDKEYFSKGYVSLDPEEAQRLMYQKQGGIIIEGPWFDGSLNTNGVNAEDYDIFTFPTEQSPVRPSVFAEMLQLNADLTGDKLAATVKLGEYLTSAEVVNKYVDTYGSPAALNTDISPTTPHLKALLDTAADGGFLIMDQALPQQVIQKWFEAQDRIALGDWTPEQAAAEVEKAVQEFKSK